MQDIIDFKLAIEKTGGNVELAKELFEMLVAELPQQIETLHVAINNNELETAWDIAHRIHGSAAYCGIPAVQEAAKSTESGIKSSSADAIQNSFKQLSELATVLQTNAAEILRMEW